MRMLAIVLAVSTVTLASGCASIVHGQSQPVSVDARMQGQSVASANCSLVNDKGTWYVTTPGSVSINRSFNDLLVTCRKDGVPEGALTVKSSTKPMAFGNIVFGGFIGAGVDIATGAAYDYPTLITIEMGQRGSFAMPPAPTDASASGATSATAPGPQPATLQPVAAPAAR